MITDRAQIALTAHEDRTDWLDASNNAQIALTAHERLRVARAVAAATSAPGTPALARAFLDSWAAYVALDQAREVAAWVAEPEAGHQPPAPSCAETERIYAELDLARGDLLAALRLSLLNDDLVPIDVLNDGDRHAVEFALRSDPLRPAWVVGVAEIAAGGDAGWAAANEDDGTPGV
jgi:hypothetical protein